MQKMKSVLLVFLAYLLFRQCIINHWCAYKQLWKSTTTKSSDWVYLNQKWFNICSINWVIFWRIENWVLLRDPNMNRLTLILFIQNPYFFFHGEKWCEYEYPSESDLIGFTLQCKRYCAQALDDDGITFFSIQLLFFFRCILSFSKEIL